MLEQMLISEYYFLCFVVVFCADFVEVGLLEVKLSHTKTTTTAQHRFISKITCKRYICVQLDN